jgi:hypothetical protein
MSIWRRSLRTHGPHPTRGYSDQIAAARLLMEVYGLTPKGKPQIRPAPLVATQRDQADAGGSDVYIPESTGKGREL